MISQGSAVHDILYLQVLQSLKKDLVVIINSDMKSKDQVTSAAKKANKTFGMTKRNVEYINKEALKCCMVC